MLCHISIMECILKNFPSFTGSTHCLSDFLARIEWAVRFPTAFRAFLCVISLIFCKSMVQRTYGVSLFYYPHFSFRLFCIGSQWHMRISGKWEVSCYIALFFLFGVSVLLSQISTTLIHKFETSPVYMLLS